jgi:hypothetical protein
MAENFLIGSSTTRANVPVTPISNGTAVANAAGTGTIALIPAYSFPANGLSASRGLRMSAWGEVATNNVPRTVALAFGTVVMGTLTATGASGGFWNMEAEVVVQAADTQAYRCRFDLSIAANTSRVVIGTGGMAHATAMNLSCVKVGTTTLASMFTQRGFIVDMLN